MLFDFLSLFFNLWLSLLTIIWIWIVQISKVYIFTIGTIAFLPTKFSPLKTLAVVLQTVWLWTLTSFILIKDSTIVLDKDHIVTIDALTVNSTYWSSTKTLTILGLAPRFRALTFDFLPIFVFLWMSCQEIVKFALIWVRDCIPKVIELR